ncbi:MAG: TonB-dependent receptor [Bacteroidota bacterium]
MSGIQITQFQQGGTFGGVSSDNYVYWGFDSPDGVGGSGEVFQPNFEQALNPQQFILTLAGVFQGESTEEDWVGQANFSYDISQRTKLKFGGKYRNKQRSSTQKSDFYVPLALFGAELPLQFYSDFEQEGYDTRGGVLQELGSPYEDILLENMMTEDALNGLLVNVYDNRDDYFATATAPNELTSFEGTENVAAAYAMAEINLSDNVLLTGGVRYEHTSLDLVGFELDTAGNLSRFEETPNYGSLLPMVNVKYQLSEDANLRLAYSRTLARPNFGNLNPTRTASNFGSNILLVSSGNPNLKPTYSNNFDLLGEYYFKDVGIASGGIFYKDLSNLIFNNLTQETIDGTTVRTSQPANLENAYLLGFELAFSKRLTFLPGFLSGFGIEANYTYTHSEVEVLVFNQETGEETVSEETLLNQPEHIYNLSLFYEKYGLTARIAANFKGDYIAEYRIEAGPEHYRFYGDNLTVDFSASYAFTNNFRIFAELNNITNEPLRYYHGTSARPEQIEFYSIRGQMGVRFSLF